MAAALPLLPPTQSRAATSTAVTENSGSSVKSQLKTLAEGGHANMGRARFNFDGLGWCAAGVLGTLYVVSRRKRAGQPTA
jgi:hypothetical protein